MGHGFVSNLSWRLRAVPTALFEMAGSWGFSHEKARDARGDAGWSVWLGDTAYFLPRNFLLARMRARRWSTLLRVVRPSSGVFRHQSTSLSTVVRAA